MKTLNFFLIIYLLLIIPLCFSQTPPSGSKATSETIQIFSKGTWRYNLNQGFGGGFGGFKVDGEKQAGYTTGDINIGADYFVADGWGVGANIYRSSSRYKYNSGSISKDADFRFIVRGMYGHSFNDKFNLLGKLSVGIGSTTDKYDSGNGSDKDKETNFDIALSASSPLRIDNNFYITPEVGYYFESGKRDDFKSNKNGLFVGVNLDLFFNCEDFFCDIKNNFSIPETRYDKGNVVIGSRSKFYLNTGGCKEKYDSEYEGGEAKYGITGTQLSANGYYYVIDNFAVGAGFGFNVYSEKGKDNDYKYNSSYFDFMPMVMVNIPVDNALRSLFIDVGVGFGTEKIKETLMEEEIVKISRFSYTVGAGWNYFITEKSCLTPYIGYSGLTRKNKDSDKKANWSGAVLGVAWYVYIPTQ